MSESAVINTAEKLGKTAASFGDSENENIKNNVCTDDAECPSSCVQNESVSMTEKYGNGLKQMYPLRNGSEESLSPKQTSPLLNGSEESLNEDRKGASDGFKEMISKQLPTTGTENDYFEELHLNSEINHANTERDDSLTNSPSDVVSSKQISADSSSQQQISADSLSDCDSKNKEDLEKLPDSPKSNTLKAGELCSDPISKQTNSLCYVDTVNSPSDMENSNGENEVHKNLSETTSLDSTSEVDANQKNIKDSDIIESSDIDINEKGIKDSDIIESSEEDDNQKNIKDYDIIESSEVDGNQKNIKDSDIIESSEVDDNQKKIQDCDMIDRSETTDSSSNINEKEIDPSPDLVVENGNVTSHEDSTAIEKCDEPLYLTEAVDQEKTVEMPPTSELDMKVKSLSEISLKAQSPLAVDETPVTGLKPSSESETVSVSIEHTREKERSNSCQDSVPQKSAADMKREEETASYCSDLEDDIEEIKMDVNETSEGCDKKEVKAHLHIYVGKSNEEEAMDEEDEKKGMDLLKISKVESFTDVVEEISEIKKDGISENSNVKAEAKKETPGNLVKKIDSKGDCKSVPKEVGDLLVGNHPSEETERVEEIKNTAQLGRDQSTIVKKDAIAVDPDSAMKVSFKNILKKRDSLETPKDAKQTTTANPDLDEPIVIDEIEAEPSTSTNLQGENKKGTENSRSEKLQTENTDAKDEDVPSNEGESAKKRSFDSSTEVSATVSPKRQRLDNVIHKLGDHVGVKSSETTTVIMDSDDDSATSPQKSDKSAKDENKMETNGRIVKLSGEMLRNLIKASMKSFVKNQVLEKDQLINDRMKKMEAAIDLWRETAKHLEKSVNELTSYTKEFRKCKSQSVKLKQLASRTVAVQVSLHQNQPKATNSLSQNRSTSLSLPPSVLRHPVPTQPGPPPNRPMAQPNGNMRPSQPTTPRQVRPGGPRGVPAIPPGSQQPNRQKVPNMNQNTTMVQSQPSFSQQTRPMVNSQLVQQLGRAPAVRQPNPSMAHASNSFQGSSSNMIDLTDEDDTSKQIKPTSPASQRTNRGSVPPPHGQNFAPNSNHVRASQPEVNSSNNPNVRAAGPGPSDRQNASTKPPTGGSLQQINNMRNVNGISVAPSTSKSGVPLNSSGLTNGQAANKAPPNETSSKAPGTSGPGTSVSPRSLPPSVYVAQPTKHPAPLPVETFTTLVNTSKVPPPKPSLKISRVAQGIVLSWNMPVVPVNVANIASYQLFAYQETNSAPSSSLWKKVGDVKALPLPMACTLVQFQEGNKYYFAVRAIDQFGRWGEYSDPSSIYLFPK